MKRGADGRAQDEQGPTLASVCEEAAAKVRNPDLKRPFSSLEDAIDRLLPYHILGAEHPNVTDQREAEEADAALLLPREDAWLTFLTTRANNISSLIVMQRKKLMQSEAELFGNSKLPITAMQACVTASAQKEMDDFVLQQKQAAEAFRKRQEQIQAAAKAKMEMQNAAKQAEEESKQQAAAQTATTTTAAAPSAAPQQQQHQQHVPGSVAATATAGAAASTATIEPQQQQQQQTQPGLTTAPSASGSLLAQQTSAAAAGGAVPGQLQQQPGAPVAPVVVELTEEEKKQQQMEAVRKSMSLSRRKFR